MVATPGPRSSRVPPTELHRGKAQRLERRPSVRSKANPEVASATLLWLVQKSPALYVWLAKACSTEYDASAVKVLRLNASKWVPKLLGMVENPVMLKGVEAGKSVLVKSWLEALTVVS